MARLYFTQGVRYLLNQQIYIVREVLAGQKLRVQNQSFGGELVVSQDELTASWARDELLFEIRGAKAQLDKDTRLATHYTIADFQALPEAVRDEAWRRYTLIGPLLKLPPEERTRKAIQALADSLKSSQPVEAQDKPVTLGTAISRSSLERWLNAFVESGYDIRALVPDVHARGAKGVPRLAADQEQVMESIFAECAAEPAYRTAYTVYLQVVHRIKQVNQTRVAHERLELPSEPTVYRRINTFGAERILRRPQSKLERHDDEPVQPGPRPTRIMQRVEMDDTILDLCLVDEVDRLPIGRPTLSFALDVYSGFPVGVYVGFEPASYRTVQNCLLHAILPKGDSAAQFGTKHPWSAYGLPETLVIDNGRAFANQHLKDACAQLGIILEQMPVRTPWFKGAIERFFRTNNTGLVHMLPGSTFANLMKRGDYDPFKHACISLTAFWQILHKFLLDFYAQQWHEGIQAIPLRKWESSIQMGYIPCLHTSADETRILLYATEERVIQRGGIEFESLRYLSPELTRMRRKVGGTASDPDARRHGPLVKIKYDPGDLRTIYVLDPTGDTSKKWIRIPVVDPAGYTTGGLSLWKHRVIRDQVLEAKREVDIEGLAEARHEIQEIVRREYMETRTGQGRRSSARLLNIGTQPAPSLSPALSAEPDSAETEATAPETTSDDTSAPATKPARAKTRGKKSKPAQTPATTSPEAHPGASPAGSGVAPDDTPPEADAPEEQWGSTYV